MITRLISVWVMSEDIGHVLLWKIVSWDDFDIELESNEELDASEELSSDTEG